MTVSVKRIYDSVTSADGYRVLVDRVWPRGIKRADAQLSLWAKDIAPSIELRTWFAHDPAKWDEFQARYRRELAQNTIFDNFQAEVRQHAAITLLTATKDINLSHALVVKAALKQ